jgi:hypothetical protein
MVPVCRGSPGRLGLGCWRFEPPAPVSRTRRSGERGTGFWGFRAGGARRFRHGVPRVFGGCVFRWMSGHCGPGVRREKRISTPNLIQRIFGMVACGRTVAESTSHRSTLPASVGIANKMGRYHAGFQGEGRSGGSGCARVLAPVRLTVFIPCGGCPNVVAILITT